MRLSTLTDIASVYNPMFSKIPLKEWQTMNNEDSVLYEVVYGESKSHHEALVPIIKQLQKKYEKLRVLELFGGNAFESHLLAEQFPEEKFFSIDLCKIPKAKQLANVSYYVGDVFRLGDAFPTNQFDIIFVGGGNASMCCIRPDQLGLLFASIKNVCHPDTIVVGSFFSNSAENFGVTLSYNEEVLEHSKKYKGWKKHELVVYKEDPFASSHQYLHAVILTKGDKRVCLYNDDGFTYYSHTLNEVCAKASEHGFHNPEINQEYGTRAVKFSYL